jgi:hypothetical protein
MKYKLLAGALSIAGLVGSASIANATVYPLYDGSGFVSTTSPIGGGGYTALDKAVDARTWQFVLGKAGYDITFGGSATDSIAKDLSLKTSTLKLEEKIGSSFTVLETLHFVDSSLAANGTSWASDLATTLHVGAGTYELVFSGGNKWPGHTKFSDGPSFSGTVSISGGVPETSTWVMMLAGFVGLGFVGYSRNRKSGVEA